MANEYSDTHKTAGENIKNILSEEQLLEMEKNGTVPPNEEFFTPEDDLDRDKAMILNWIYPVGIIIHFAENVDPNAIMPGQKWEKIEGRFLLASSEDYPLKATGGEKEHTLTISEMPSHDHRQRFNNTYGSEYGGFAASESKYNSNYWWCINTAPTGGGQPHNNMPPYLVVNVWKRTA